MNRRQLTGLAEIIYTARLSQLKTWAELKELLVEISRSGLNLSPLRGGYQIDIIEHKDGRIFYNYADGNQSGSCRINNLFRYFVVRQP